VTKDAPVMSLSASLLQKISAAIEHLHQITLNQKLLRKSKKWYKFSSHIRVKQQNKEYEHKKDKDKDEDKD
jgi:biotin-(acetyl-CoA carboxylase) ligase